MRVPNLNKWYISYDPYTDNFQMYDGAMLKKYKSDLRMEKDGNTKLYFTKKTPRLLLIEVDGAYSKFKKDINDLSKKQVVGLVKPLVSSYI